MKQTLLKSLFTVVLLLIATSNLSAQTMSVASFEAVPNDMSAMQQGTKVLDQNGDPCAIIKIMTKEKGFTFDVGSLGIVKTIEKIGEVWVYVPFGIKRISINHHTLNPITYNIPISIEKGRVYRMFLTSDKIFVNIYDDTRKQKLSIKIKPANSTFTLNGMHVHLDNNGNSEQELSFGTYTYKVEADGYYPKEGQITIDDSLKKQLLIIDDLIEIKGKLSVHTNPHTADVYIDGISIGRSTSLVPYELRIGRHNVEVKANGYKTETKIVNIKENRTTDIQVNLSRLATYSITSSPSGANIFINKENLGTTPCKKELITGTYIIKATKTGYKDFNKSMSLNSSDPNISISLAKIYNYKNEFYLEGNIRAGGFMAFGGTLGGYINNVNIEASYLYGTTMSETIYWSNNNTLPISCQYSPQMTISGKFGYGLALGSRYRLTPQIGLNVLKLKETIENGSGVTPADGANVASALVSVRFSAAIVNNFAISVSPEYSFAVTKSKGFTALSDVSTTIKKWGEGFNVKLGITAFF